MRVFVFGAKGMLGSQVVKVLRESEHSVRSWKSDITLEEDLIQVFEGYDPHVVINCAGIVKSECDRVPMSRVVTTNAVAPHSIARLAKRYGCRVIHISTDCVFSGASGENKTESSRPDAIDLYGVSKMFGELSNNEHCVTLRTSFIGRDPERGRGLLEWLLSMPPGSAVPGYSRHWWSGLSAIELARVIGKVVIDDTLSGLYHVTGPSITKEELLRTLIDAYGLQNTIHVDDTTFVDRSLDGSKFQERTGYSPPAWSEMARELAAK